MNVWRPSASIRVLVIGLAWRDDGLLAAEVTDDAGRIVGVRPLGGSVEFGERREEALAREFREELGADIAVGTGWTVIENIFVHEGRTGHEFVFAAPVTFLDRSFYDRDVFAVAESDASAFTARWFSPAQLRRDGVPLFPEGLVDAI